jgi:molecular chaperone DnaK (HSP70)
MLDTKEITELFGFDLGDGESAVAWMRFGSPVPPQLIEVAGRKNFLTALGQHPSLGELIAEQALLAGADRLHVRFKGNFPTRPLSAAHIEAFARVVLAELRKSGRAERPESCAFFIGCPSGWADADRARYKKVFERAGYRNIRIISESRAAFMFVRESGELRATKDTLDKPTLIVDAGSSTTDFTFVHRLESQPVDFGESLGGGLIDRALLDLNLRRSPNEARLREIFRLCPPYLARCELEARKVKEQYFTRRRAANGARFEMPCESSVKVYYDDPPLSLDLSADDGDIEAVLTRQMPQLSGLSILSAFGKGFERARALLLETPPEVILLTGGASRMDFVAQIARDVFPRAALLRGAEPEFAIARGLCHALDIDLKTARFRREVRSLVDSGAIARAVSAALPDLYRRTAPIIAASLIDECAPDALRRWKLGEIGSIEDMGSEIARLVAQDLESGEGRLALQQAAAAWAPTLRPALEALTDPICARYGLSAASLHLSAAFFVDAGALDLKTDGGMMELGHAQTAVDLAVAAVAAALMGGGGMALLMAGPVGLAISFVIGFAASRLGTTLARARLIKADLPLFVRAAFSGHAYKKGLEKKRARLTDSLYDQLCMDLQGPGESARATIDALTDAIARQLDALGDQARILIH